MQEFKNLLNVHLSVVFIIYYKSITNATYDKIAFAINNGPKIEPCGTPHIISIYYF